jgi:integrase
MPATGDRITKRKDGLFQGMYTAHTPDGPKRKYVYGRKYGEVAQTLAEAMGDAARGVVFDAGTLTVGEWLDAWLSDLKPLMGAGKMTYSTYKRYAGIIRKHLKPALGHRKLHTGLRQGELLGLKWSDLDGGKLSVRRALKIAAQGLDFGPPKNKASRRSVRLNRTAAAALRAHRTRQNEERIAAPEWWDGDLVCPNRVGKPMDPNNLYHREYKPILKCAGLAEHGFTFHALRHTFATALFARGEHPKKVQSLLGHSSITQTMDTYSHLIDDIGGDAVDKLDDAFGL